MVDRTYAYQLNADGVIVSVKLPLTVFSVSDGILDSLSEDDLLKLGDFVDDDFNVLGRTLSNETIPPKFFYGLDANDPNGIIGNGAGGLLLVSNTAYQVGDTIAIARSTPGEGGKNQYDLTLDQPINFTVCFLAGTMIATPVGERPVETLAAGDPVLTAEGQTRPVIWIGRQTVVAAFADPPRSYPIRIATGALADGVPARDLYVSPDHALLVDGILVQAGALVNGTTVTRIAQPEDHFIYYHIELEDHALVLAEGASAETFVDNVTRQRFDNYAEYEALFGRRPAHIPELALPRVKSARQLPRAVRERLAARAEALGLVAAAAA